MSTYSSIEEKIEWARRIHREQAAELLQDRNIVQLLDKLRSETQASRQAMIAAGVVAICRRCEDHDGGSCCGAGIEDRYDGITLLINLLLDVSIPSERLVPDSCYLLGPTGCVLQARDVICINFMCTQVTNSISPLALSLLREAEGAELETLFLLHDRLGRLLGRIG
ncbi:MAG: hypothetical protein DRI90_18940 [Deltaproteobacteria bacterium]|nr:MAG: hypothetical protein DRI90_18940 [Deltaproteobacteria bacterium]